MISFVSLLQVSAFYSYDEVLYLNPNYALKYEFANESRAGQAVNLWKSKNKIK